MNRLISAIIIVLTALSVFSSCKKEEEVSSIDNLAISVKASLTVEEGTTVKCSFIEGRGPIATDQVVLKATDGSAEFTYDIFDLEKTSFCFKIGSGFVSGTYTFCIKRGTTLRAVSKVTFTVPAKDGLSPAVGSTVYGKVCCNGNGVKGVAVSDGYEVVTTDDNGVYQMRSEKANNYVFISIPAGYKVASKGIVPQFFKFTKSAASQAERIDFDLIEDGDQTNHTMLFFGDMHLAGGKQNDRTQFAKFTAEIKQYMAKHSGEKIYAMTLGDMTWDLYWYSKSYSFEQYLADANTMTGLPVYHTIGNHDHDMNATGDWDTAIKYKTTIGPNYYSFNIGKIHYIVLDNIQCTNATASTTNGDARTYTTVVVKDEIAWLKKDLALIPKTTPIVATMHASAYTQYGEASLKELSTLTGCFSGYTNVRFVTGHTHKIWNIDKNNIHENNSGAVCGAWWWAGYYNPELNLAQDGAPAGYRVMDVQGMSMTSYFKGTGKSEKLQFRSYDRNKINIQPADYGVTKNVTECNDYLTKYGAYNTASSDNYVYINVWDYGTGWTVSVTENGKDLTVTRLESYDPLYLVLYPVNRFNSTTSVSFSPTNTYHMFRVRASSATSTLEIKVTDDEGRIYTETMNRPKTFSINAYK